MSGKGWKGQAQEFGNVPRALKNKAKYRKRSHSAPKCRIYGPTKKDDSYLRDLKIHKRRNPELAKAIEERKKEKDEDDKKVRIPEKEAEKLPQLTVCKINFHIRGKCGTSGQPDVPGNSRMHHTDKFKCRDSSNPRAIFRRGQEFKVTITFDREYNDMQDDLLLIVTADEDSHGKCLSARIKVNEERRKPFTDGHEWAARIVKRLPEKKALKLAIYIPGISCPVGEWNIKVKTTLRGEEMACIYEHPEPFYVLFNPWSNQDQVYYTGDQDDLNEYILNDDGIAYFGVSYWVREKPWRYGQFEPEVMESCLLILRKAFNMKMTAGMSDPVTVARALTRTNVPTVEKCGKGTCAMPSDSQINCMDDDGVLVGNWSGNYDGGVSPVKWICSANILKQFCEEGAPVKYGQCWVFSHVLTAVCRALGLPCRSVTNFDSAHDTDGTCSIDRYHDRNGKRAKAKEKDSIWNFHVWNEVWIQRPDIQGVDCYGWHVIDATPQEQSDGCYQCGPCPVAAVKRGLVYLGYDARFIFSEVNADIANWHEVEDGEWKCTSVEKREIGHAISTKCPNKNERMDLTYDYKYKEDTEDERQAVMRAVRYSARGEDMYTQSADIQLSIEKACEPRMGSDLKVNVVVKNVSKEKKMVDFVISAHTASYWNDSDTTRELIHDKKPSTAIGPGQTEKIPFVVTKKQYTDKTQCTQRVFVYACCKDIEKKMPYTKQMQFELDPPKLVLQEETVSCRAMQVVTETVTFINPLDISLTGCEVLMEGDLLPGGVDKDKFTCFYGMYGRPLGDVAPNAKVTVKFHLYWKEDEDEKSDDSDSDDGECATAAPAPPAPRAPKKACKSQKLEFYCHQLESISTTCTVNCDRS